MKHRLVFVGTSKEGWLRFQCVRCPKFIVLDRTTIWVILVEKSDRLVEAPDKNRLKEWVVCMPESGLIPRQRRALNGS